MIIIIPRIASCGSLIGHISGVRPVSLTFKTLLQEADPEHSLNAYGWTTSLIRGIMGFNQAAKFPPRDDGFHLAQKAITPRLLMVSLKTNAGKGNLTNGTR